MDWYLTTKKCEDRIKVIILGRDSCIFVDVAIVLLLEGLKRFFIVRYMGILSVINAADIPETVYFKGSCSIRMVKIVKIVL